MSGDSVVELSVFQGHNHPKSGSDLTPAPRKTAAKAIVRSIAIANSDRFATKEVSPRSAWSMRSAGWQQVDELFDLQKRKSTPLNHKIIGSTQLIALFCKFEMMSRSTLLNIGSLRYARALQWNGSSIINK